jgi:hypothetical protein
METRAGETEHRQAIVPPPLAAKRDFLRRLKISLPRKAGILNGEENTSQMEGKK